MPVIEIDSLSKTYRKGRRNAVKAVDGLTLSILESQVFGFLGPNGAGKTTTIKMMCGLITPDSGAVRLNGFDVARQRSRAMRQFGVVLEGTRSIYWRLTAWQNLMYFARLKGCTGKRWKAHAEWLLSELGLWDRRNESVRAFSRGMQQKVAVACALVADPPIVLLDEPTLGLDVQAARTVREWVRKLSAEHGKTVILTTHQLDMAQELCHRVAIINTGRLLTSRPVRELLDIFAEGSYNVRIRGQIPDAESFLPGLIVADASEDGETVLTGIGTDQERLHQVLRRVHEAGLPLLSVERETPSLEEVFMRFVEDGV